MQLSRLILVILAAALGGAINSIAGGGTLLTFPAIVGLGLSPLVANATSTVALWPAALGSMWGYRSELAGARTWALWFALPSLLGGALGAWLLLHTSSESFARLVPFLVLGATVLFAVQPRLMRWKRTEELETTEGAGPALARPPVLFLLYQFLVGVYGGYFGAGIGILMLAALGFMGLRNIHQMNGLKNWGGLCINAVAAGMFAFSGIVNWPVALGMAVGGLLGGYGGARAARHVSQKHVRLGIVVVGFAAFLWLLLKRP
jgi:uncharacterized membrane protein YfcA